MYKVKKYIVTICIMIIAAIVSLLVVSVLTYLFKWQSDKAMAGIVITYILSGLAGGFYLRNEGAMEIRKNVIEAVLLSTLFIFSLIIFSSLVFKIPFGFSVRFLLIWLLVTCSLFGGMCVVKK